MMGKVTWKVLEWARPLSPYLAGLLFVWWLSVEIILLHCDARYAIDKNYQANQEHCSIGNGIAGSPITAVFLWAFELLGSALHHHNEIIALGTIFLAWFTYALFKATRGVQDATVKLYEAGERQIAIAGSQTDLLKAQQEISRLQYLAEHRPRLKVRHVNIMPPVSGPIGHSTLPFIHGAEVKAALVVVNVGGSEAEIVTTRHRIFVSRVGLPPLPPYITKWHADFLKQGEILESGKTTTSTDLIDTLVMDGPLPGTDLRLREFDEGGWVLYVMGQIRYRTPGSNVQRFMGFCRQRTAEGRFRAVDDADYEYED